MTARGPARRRTDTGFTLTEVMVSMALMSMVMAIVTGGMITMYRTSDRAEAGARTQAALIASFERLDREVRYAQRVNDAGTTADGAFAVTYVLPDADGDRFCVQLSIPTGGGALVRRQWPYLSSTADPAATRAVVATDLVPSTAGQNPFTRSAPDDTVNYDRLRITLTSRVGLTGRGADQAYDLHFTALNTVRKTVTLACPP